MTASYSEFELINSIALITRNKKKSIIVDIGDDAAVFKSSKEGLNLITTDMFVEDVHFDLKYCGFDDIGHKIVSANLSDIAAMGGTPKYLVVSIALPEKVKKTQLDQLYEGMTKLGTMYDTSIIGGDITSSPNDLIISITVVGTVAEKDVILRSGAQVGDDIFVTGFLGDSIAGYQVLTQGGKQSPPWKSAIEKHLIPNPRIFEARFLTESLHVKSMIDISDGLSSDLHHICERSEVGAVIDCRKLPISKAASEIAANYGDDVIDYSLNGGEDFELLFTTSDNNRFNIARAMSERFGISCTCIGQILDIDDGVSIIKPDGQQRHLKAAGWDHMKGKKNVY